MTVLVVDLETTIHKSFKRKANPFDPRNRIVATGQKNINTDSEVTLQYHEPGDEVPPWNMDGVTYLVFCNAKFDLLYRWGEKWLKDFFKRGGKIWCIQYAQYLLSGQTMIYPGLDDIAPIYGGTVKEDPVKKLWEAGVDTADIPQDLLMPYLQDDTLNTEIAFRGQIAQARQRGMMAMIQARMDGLLATTDMEYNGLVIDLIEGAKRKEWLEEQEQTLIQRLNMSLPEFPEGLNFNWGSGDHLSAILFGGKIKYEGREPCVNKAGEQLYLYDTVTEPVMKNGEPVKYKSGKKVGQIKTRKVKVPREIKTRKCKLEFPVAGFMPGKGRKTKKDGVFKTDEKALKALKGSGIPFIEDLLKWRQIDKDLGTYYERDGKGMMAMVQGDGKIHHKLNHTQTVTTRLSSSDPNLQNVSGEDKSEAKKMFISRFGPDGSMIEADYSQLEVVIKGMLSGDENLCQDLRDKLDFHCKRLAKKLGRAYEEIFRLHHEVEDPDIGLQRKKIKPFSFQLAYGAGPKTISEGTGLSVAEVKQLIANEEEMYPGTVDFDESVKAAVEASRVPTDKLTYGGHPRGMGQWRCLTGTHYTFYEIDAPRFLKERGIMTNFYNPEMKNYPVQGTGGEVVQIAFGRLWRHFLMTDNYDGKAFMVNTVHDCVWADSHKSVREQVMRDMIRIMEAIPAYLKELYDLDVTVPFPVEAEYGPNMMELKRFHA